MGDDQRKRILRKELEIFWKEANDILSEISIGPPHNPEDPKKSHYWLLNHLLSNDYIIDGGLWLEFGVYRGYSVNLIAGYTKNTVYGFDSFEGLPEDWGVNDTLSQKKEVRYHKGKFSLQGMMPDVLKT